MSRPDLFPYERVCPECGGDKPAGCDECDGAGVVYADRRYVENQNYRAIVDEIETIHRETVARLVRTLFEERESADKLVAENRSLRTIAHDQERRLAALEKQHRDAMRLLDVADMRTEAAS